MRPKTISASSLQAAQDCLAMYHAKYFDYIPESGKKEPAKRGTTVHYALQHFVDLVCIQKTADWDDTKLLKKLYDEGYVKTFLTADRQNEWYKSGWEMVKTWHKRTDLSEIEVLSVEQKRRTPVPSARYDRKLPAAKQPAAGIVPLSYIIDRVDRYIHPATGNRVIRCVDYKTQNKPLSADKVKRKLQAKVYAAAAMVYYKDEKPDEIRVQLDFLQYDPIEVVFTIEECVGIWVDLRRELQRILDVNEKKTKLPRTMGAHCKYCPIAFTCEELKKNVDGGGIHSLDTNGQAALRAELQVRREAAGAIIKQLDEHLLEEATEQDVTEFKAGEHTVRLKLSSRRYVDQYGAMMILGVERYASLAPMTMAKYDELMKGDELDLDQKKRMRGIVEKRWSEELTVEVVLDDADEEE